MGVTRSQYRIKDIQPVLKIAYYCDECEDFVLATNVSNSGEVTIHCSNAFNCQKVARRVEAAIDKGKRPEPSKPSDIKERVEKILEGRKNEK